MEVVLARAWFTFWVWDGGMYKNTNVGSFQYGRGVDTGRGGRFRLERGLFIFGRNSLEVRGDSYVGVVHTQGMETVGAWA